VWASVASPRPSEAILALPFGLFAPALLFHHPLRDGYIKDTDEILQTVT
jgi:hypothetical protein